MVICGWIFVGGYLCGYLKVDICRWIFVGGYL